MKSGKNSSYSAFYLGADGGQDAQKEKAALVGNGQLPYMEGIESGHQTSENAAEAVSSCRTGGHHTKN